MSAADFLAGICYVAVLYVLVRPQSKGGALITALGAAMVAIVKNAADLAA